MAVYKDIDSFMKEVRKQVESAMKNKVLPKIKEKAQEIVITKIYSAYTPKIYERTMELIEAFQIETKWEGDTYVGILKVREDLHSDNPTWKGKVYPLDEIINEYFVRGGWGNGSPRAVVDTLGLTAQEMLETGKALRILLDELRKYFDIS